MNEMFGLGEEKDKSNNSELLDNKDHPLSLEELEANREKKLGIIGKRGRKPKTDAIQDKLVESLFNPVYWSEVGSLPFNIRKAMTGSHIFDLTKDQKDSLGSPLAVMMRLLIEIDPKWIALTLFFTNLTSIMTEKEILWTIEKKKIEKNKPNVKA